jgi:hypothetical protein
METSTSAAHTDLPEPGPGPEQPALSTPLVEPSAVPTTEELLRLELALARSELQQACLAESAATARADQAESEMRHFHAYYLAIVQRWGGTAATPMDSLVEGLLADNVARVAELEEQLAATERELAESRLVAQRSLGRHLKDSVTSATGRGVRR